MISSTSTTTLQRESRQSYASQSYGNMASIEEVQEVLTDLRIRTPSPYPSPPTNEARRERELDSTPRPAYDRSTTQTISPIPFSGPQFSFNKGQGCYSSSMDPMSYLPTPLPSPNGMASMHYTGPPSPSKPRRSFAEQLESALLVIAETRARSTTRSESRQRGRGRSIARRERGGEECALRRGRSRSSTLCRACCALSYGSKDPTYLEPSSHRVNCPARPEVSLALGFGYSQGERTAPFGSYNQLPSIPLGYAVKLN